jgi:hypothetical protein
MLNLQSGIAYSRYDAMVFKYQTFQTLVIQQLTGFKLVLIINNRLSVIKLLAVDIKTAIHLLT